MLALGVVLLGAVTVCAALHIGLKIEQSQFIDQSNHRSLHQGAVARIGGLIFVPLLLLFSCWLYRALPLPPVLTQLAVAGSALWLLAVFDDAKDLSAGLRLFMQILVSLFAAWSFYALQPHWLWGLWFFYALACINFYNFMDGSDGIAAVQGIVGFAACGLFAWWLWPESHLHWLALLQVVVLVAFLTVNWQPAKMFMGDAGSTVLGFAAASWAALFYCQSPRWFYLAVVPFLPFWLDASITLLKRIWRGEKFWQPHRQHYYQRQILAGNSHAQIAIVYGVASALVSVLAAGLLAVFY